MVNFKTDILTILPKEYEIIFHAKALVYKEKSFNFNGILCLVKSTVISNFLFLLCDSSIKEILWQHELSKGMQYKVERNDLHLFWDRSDVDGHDVPIYALNFADSKDATQFLYVLKDNHKSLRIWKDVIHRKLSKSSISEPENFQHLYHMGVDDEVKVEYWGSDIKNFPEVSLLLAESNSRNTEKFKNELNQKLVLLDNNSNNSANLECNKVKERMGKFKEVYRNEEEEEKDCRHSHINDNEQEVEIQIENKKKLLEEINKNKIFNKNDERKVLEVYNDSKDIEKRDNNVTNIIHEQKNVNSEDSEDIETKQCIKVEKQRKILKKKSQRPTSFFGFPRKSSSVDNVKEMTEYSCDKDKSTLPSKFKFLLGKKNKKCPHNMEAMFKHSLCKSEENISVMDNIAEEKETEITKIQSSSDKIKIEEMIKLPVPAPRTKMKIPPPPTEPYENFLKRSSLYLPKTFDTDSDGSQLSFHETYFDDDQNQKNLAFDDSSKLASSILKAELNMLSINSNNNNNTNRTSLTRSPGTSSLRRPKATPPPPPPLSTLPLQNSPVLPPRPRSNKNS